MNELQRHIRKLASCDANRRVLQAQEQFAVPREDDSDPFADVLRRLDEAEQTLKRHH